MNCCTKLSYHSKREINLRQSQKKEMMNGSERDTIAINRCRKEGKQKLFNRQRNGKCRTLERETESFKEKEKRRA